MGWVLGQLRAIFRREAWMAELWSGTAAFAWTGLSYASGQMLSSWPSMRLLAQFAGDEIWHMIGFGLAGAQFLFLLFDQRSLRWVAALAMGWFWGFLTLGVWVATPWAPAVAVYAAWCGVNVYAILHLLHRHG